MEWQVLLVLLFAVTIILFPAAFIWYLNIGGVYAAIRKRGKISVPVRFTKVMRISLAVIIPVVIYGCVIWFSYGHFGWPVALAVALVMPFMLLAPVLIWASVASGLVNVALYRFRRKRSASARLKSGGLAKEPVNISEV